MNQTGRLLCALSCIVTAVSADVILRDGLDKETDGWHRNVRGDASLDFSAEGRNGNCLHVKGAGGIGYYTRELPLQQVRGRTVTVTCWAKLADVRIGEEEYLTAKLHIVQFVNGNARNHATRFVGTADWEQKTLQAQIDPAATRVVLDLGIQNATGDAWFDDLLLEDGRQPEEPLNLSTAATTSRSDSLANDGRGGFIDLGELDLRDLPSGDRVFAGTTFRIPTPGQDDGRNCIVLKGGDRSHLPLKTPAAVTFEDRASAVSLLCAAYAPMGWSGPLQCAALVVTYADGSKAKVALRLDHEIGSFIMPVFSETWIKAWDSPISPKARKGLGVFLWQNPKPDTAIAELAFATDGRGPALIIVGITAHRHSPSPQSIVHSP